MKGNFKPNNHLLWLLIAVVTLFLISGCASGSPAGGISSSADPERGGGQLQAADQNPPEITLAPAGTSVFPALPGEQGSGNIASQSGQGQIGGNEDEPGQIDSFAPEELTGEEAPGPINWLTYQDEAFKFTIAYPDTYTILAEPPQLQEVKPGLVHRVRFQDIDLAASDNSNLEIPQFSIEVFDLGDLPLKEFVKTSTQGSNLDDYSQGGLRGFRVSSDILIAPNEYYYFTDGVHAYILTPLGQYSQEMLDSFELRP